MAQLSLAHSRASLPKQLANFTKSTAGLDLTLRLLHSLALIGAEIDFDSATAMRCSVAASQIGLARHYLRFFSFLDCFQNVQDILAAGCSVRNRTAMMELIGSSCLGMYLVLEGTTMLHDMNIFLVSWYTPILLEAYKFWFYALCIAIAKTVSDLVFGPAAPSTPNGSVDEKTKVKASGNSSPSKPAPLAVCLLNRLVIDCLDLTIPGYLLGWIPVSNIGVAIAMLASTILVWPTAWAKAQQ